MIMSDDVFVPTSNANSLIVKKHQHRHNVNNRYEFMKTLGKGNYGKVKLARHKENDKLVAVKAIRKEKVKDSTDMRHLRREIEIMSSINHPHIIQIYEVFENEDKIVIVMEYAAGGELYDYLSSKPNVSDEEAKCFFRQIVSAIRYCHNKGIVHRDIKLENILLDENRSIKIADFGLANSFRMDKCLDTFCGSPLYASPEIVRGVPYKGPEVDSWSLGVLLYALVYGTMPFDGRNYSTLTKQITSGTFAKPRKHSDAYELICWLLKVDSRQRATINDVAAHCWMAPFPEEQYSASTRSGVIESGGLLNTNLAPTDRSEPITCRKVNIQGSSTPKSILKHRVSLEEKPHSEPATPSMEETLAQKLAAVCRLSEKSSRALQSTSLGVKHKLLRNRGDRESGYYSSPERARHALRETSSVSDPSLFNSSKSSPPSQLPHSVVTERCSWPRGDHPSSVPLQTACCEFENCTLKQRFTSISSDDGCTSSQTRTESTCSDSSILSTDSVDICTPSASPHFSSPYLLNSSKSTPRQRPTSLPVTSGSSSSPNKSNRHASGSLTPKSEMLVRELERILAPSGRRKRRQEVSLTRHNNEPCMTSSPLPTFNSNFECRNGIDNHTSLALSEV